MRKTTAWLLLLTIILGIMVGCNDSKVVKPDSPENTTHLMKLAIDYRPLSEKVRCLRCGMNRSIFLIKGDEIIQTYVLFW
ncbi:hypothetical protein LC040_02135 [Bacillus tianshenii]|nr:hypothetical protein LC040_02135 [Bacillus tianshenii]